MTKCELRVISGARVGHREVFDKSYIGLGRHPLSDLRFDAEKDLDASTRHAAIVKNGDAWVLRDLGSTNGTFVNGEKVTGDRPLRDGETIKFGVHGPEAVFHLIRDEEEVVMPAVHAPDKPAPVPTSKTAPEMTAPTAPPPLPPKRTPPPPPRGARPDDRTADMPQKAAPPSKTSVLRAEVGTHRSRVRGLLVMLVIVIAGALGVVYWQGRTSSDALTSATNTVIRLTAELDTLQRLRAQADSERTVLQARIRAENDPTRVAQLRTRLTQVEQRSTAIQQAEGVDFGSIQARNQRAIAVIAVRFPDTTQMWEGTAFSVNAQGLMITNRHLVVNNAGQRARDIAVRFHGSTEVLPARLVRVAPDADLATIQIESAGPFNSVTGMDNQLPPGGAPIALIGFPGGCGSCTRPIAKLVTGTVTSASDSLLELDAFSGTGASGSPIFDKSGKVIGVLYGGRGGSSSAEIVGLPIRRAMVLINP